jgi:hypothetical protein
MEDKIKIAANEIFTKIKELPIGSKFIPEDYFADYKFEMEDNFELLEEIFSLCDSNNIQIDTTQDDMEMGMPWVYTYKKEN